MAETVEPVDVSPDGDESTEQDERPSVTELLVQLGRDLSVLALCEAQLQASRNMPEVRRAARDLAAALLVVVALAAAFVFANVAAFEGLSTVVSGWVAALVLCAVWIVVGVSLLDRAAGQGGTRHRVEVVACVQGRPDRVHEGSRASTRRRRGGRPRRRSSGSPPR